MQRECKNCNHCKQIGRQNMTTYGYGKKHYWCEHPEIEKIPFKKFGNSARGFIGFGTNTLTSPLSLKTHPRWCPMELKNIERI